MSKAQTGASYLAVVAAALVARGVITAYRQRHRRLSGYDDPWGQAVRLPQGPSDPTTGPPAA
jgi:hypothetical protein